MSVAFSTKAGTLTLLQGRLASARVAPLIFFTVADWRANRAGCLARVPSTIGNGPWIVRSSCQREDSAGKSNAGAFLSEPNVTIERLQCAIERVIASYGEATASDEVLIQPMLRNVVRAGVAFSHDPNTCSPYRVVNWSEGSNTATVTGGMGGRTWQQAALSPFAPPPELAGVIKLLEELSALFRDTPVDCEFAVTNDDGRDVLWLLQARPLVLPHGREIRRGSDNSPERHSAKGGAGDGAASVPAAGGERSMA